ncbi:MAG: transcription termination/antitermination factor NusG [bacterium]|nr:transcription termination/antitermination factor NusG [bacterium]
MNKKKWYVIHARTLYEEKVRDHILKEVEEKNISDKIEKVFVPTEDVVEIYKNKKRVKKRNFFPGYLLIYTTLEDDVYWVVKNTPNVTDFLGGKRPVPMPDNEAEALLADVEGMGDRKPKPAISFYKDENVRIIEGVFANFVGVVDEVNPEKGRLSVMVSIFGRATPVVVDFLQVEKI